MPERRWLSGIGSRGLRVADGRTRRRTLAVLVAVVALLLVVAIPAFAVWSIALRSQTRVPAGRAVELTIPDGAGTSAIADLLAGRGVVRNAVMFRIRMRLDGVDGRLRPGPYRLTTGMSIAAVERALLAGPALPTVRVTIPEGFTIERIADRLQAQAGISRADLIELATHHAAEFAGRHPCLRDASTGSLEGYLFPKTYRFVRGGSARQAIETMLDQFDREIVRVDLAGARSRGLSMCDVVIIASMIEREAKVPRDRALVSSVIRNRLDAGMKLEIDATVAYVLKVDRPRLLNRDIAVRSPYNTYLHRGLPPGPIASPGLASLDAAAHPADTLYLYYVRTGKDGSHTFTRTRAAFLKAKALSRKVVR